MRTRDEEKSGYAIFIPQFPGRRTITPDSPDEKILRADAGSSFRVSVLIIVKDFRDSSHFAVLKPDLDPVGMKRGVRKYAGNNPPGLLPALLVLLLYHVHDRTDPHPGPVPPVGLIS
jgi:hypothetical protein